MFHSQIIQSIPSDLIWDFYIILQLCSIIAIDHLFSILRLLWNLTFFQTCLFKRLGTVYFFEGGGGEELRGGEGLAVSISKNELRKKTCLKVGEKGLREFF